MDKFKVESLDDLDNNDYRVIELNNGLVATLFHQSELFEKKKEDVWSKVDMKKAPDSTVKLSIDVGWNSDPVEMPGLAHLLQHVVPSSSSDKNPELISFENYINTKGGKYSSSSTAKNTFFHFGINKEHLVEAVDIFSEFIVSSSVNEESVIREFKRINPTTYDDNSGKTTCESEPCLSVKRYGCHKSKLKNLLDSLLKETPLAVPKLNHDETITDKNQLAVLLNKFKERHYSAHRMKLVIKSELPLDKLEECIRECFSKIPNNKLPTDDAEYFSKSMINYSLSSEQDFTKFYKLRSSNDLLSLYLSWRVPKDCGTHAAWEYLKNIFNSTSWGSLNQYLNAKKWCRMDCKVFSSDFVKTIYFSDYTDSTSNCTVVSLVFVLTEDGFVHHVKDIIDATFSMINKLRYEEPSESLFNDFKITEQFWLRKELRNKRLKESYSSLRNIKFLNSRMHFDGTSEAYPFVEFNSEAVKKCIDLLTPDKVNIILLGDKLSEDYSKTDIPETWISDWSKIEPLPELKLPALNPFLPSSDLVQDYDFNSKNASKIPKRIFHNETIEVWHSADTDESNGNNMCHFNVDVISPISRKSAESSVLLDLFNGIVNYAAGTSEHNQTKAGTYIRYKSMGNGIMIIEGRCHRENLSQALHMALKYVVDCRKYVTKRQFDWAKECLIRKYTCSFYCLNISKHLLVSLVDTNFWLPTDKKAALQKIDFDQLVKFAREISDNLKFECLLLGNMKEDDARDKICQSLSGFDLRRTTETHGTVRAVKEFYEVQPGITDCQVKCLYEDCSRSMTLHFYQIIHSNPQDFIKLRIMIELLEEIVSKPLDDLKNEKNFGSMTKCQLFKTIHKITKGLLGFTIRVEYEARSFTPKHINAVLDEFVKSIIDTLKNMSIDEFTLLKSNFLKSYKIRKIYENFLLINAMKINDWKNLEESNLLSSVISDLQLDEFLRFLEDHIVKHRKLSLHIVGHTDVTHNDDYSEAHENYSDAVTVLISETKDDKTFYIDDIDSYKTNLNKFNQPDIEFSSCAEYWSFYS